MKILSVFGTRPEAIKMAVLVQKLNANPNFTHKLCVTGQHRELLAQVLDIFKLKPDYDLAIMQPGQDLSDITSRILLSIRSVFTEFRPDLVLVHGDTTTCFATTLAAFYAGIPVGHVEAGLRTGNLQAPFPEEANRVMVSRLATYHFAPTPRNVEVLKKEGVPLENILQTGNTVIDALLQMAGQVTQLSDKWKGSAVEKIILEKRKILLVTGHRRENFGQGFIEICQALATLAQKYPQLEILYPVHLNPNVQKPVYEIIGNFPNIHLVESLSYEDFIFVMKNAFLILTDSGGVQEEAPGLGKPVLVMRDTTERPEAVDAGTVKLVGANATRIIAGVSELLEDETIYTRMAQSTNPYGDGKATERIITFLEQLASKKNGSND
ncbi:UDP-N-acetylglucosamine 2-epimerase (non-hydrolyzing) [Cytophagaceae bacterium DM2B3-1]|uniref:UDP-N-acetylglucosamine 2-epimerase (non-hydrolyzing) n=1 Tax=Xanthocytophaga flava TaxID=3048013 RepID=A0ABT7CUN4_9BACT|nr:UDP-N-acetylglucosamine 2-epimerase (non-hydrolyzing) [Xanthocytophaga flavus]MDJ1467042.1 UDP-N-acetylglucosamine 2-epimerase (non-hydrolyzing) [Xanthocytophaga flavus]MDJ1497462.1 UDP-N-acetylglucosamine 2-epimerase (non-hydrolyzing) [Xanthocytophaga flavus]